MRKATEMKNTYTFVARSAVDPSRIVTLTLHDHHLSIGAGPPVEQIERAAESEGDQGSINSRLWLRPLALSLLERGTRPFPVDDVFADIDDDILSVKAWFRVAGLRGAPVTLVDGRVDNPEGAIGFVQELRARKAEQTLPFGFLELLDYWATWILGGIALLGGLAIWRRWREPA